MCEGKAEFNIFTKTLLFKNKYQAFSSNIFLVFRGFVEPYFFLALLCLK